MDQGKHILSDFDVALKQLKDDTISIGSMAHRNIEHSVRGLLERNTELCNQVIADDDEVDQLEIQIDNEGVNLMAKFRPFATDLRLVIASMKITNNLERISDHAVSIAKRSRKMLRNQEVAETAFIEPVFQLGNRMLSDSLAAYADSNTELALKVTAQEDELKLAHKQATKSLSKHLEDKCDNYRDYLDLVFISRWLERVGNLAVNIAEDVVFMTAATDIRHGGDLPEV